MILAKNRLNAGWEFHQQGKLEDAEAIYRRVIQDFPKRTDAWIYFGMSLNDQTRYNEALAAYDRALTMSADNVSAWTNRGNTLSMMGNHQAGLQSHRKALQISPEFARGHTNLGVQLLRMGRAKEGWAEYDWRMKTGVFSPPNCKLPFWRGENLKNKHLLIHGEQGLGDEIQTLRYISSIAEQAAKVTLTADEKLHALFTRSLPKSAIPEIEILIRGRALPAADLQTCALSLPRYLGYGPTGGYLTVADTNRRAWAADLCRLEGLKIGISWCGNPQNPMNTMRSVPLAKIVDAIPRDNVNLISLQAMHGHAEIERLSVPSRMYRPLQTQNPHGVARSIDEMAALVANLDLVITCDSICAHLASGLGVETWLLLAAVPDWRWGISGQRSQWYDKLRLFRQQRQGDWRSVCKQVGNALVEKIGNGNALGNAPGNDQASAINLTTMPDPALPLIGTTLDGCTEQKQCRHGVFRFLSGDQYIGQSLRHYGEFSEQEVALFNQILHAGDTVLEVGSNIGTHTIPLAKIVGDTGRVLAFEPQRHIFELLQHNAQANYPTQITTHRQALGAAASTIIVPLLDPAKANNFGGVPLGDHQHGDKVVVSTVDALNISQCNLLKADVEGMEADVLRGALQTIKEHQPLLYLENDRESKSAELVKLIKSLGYRIYMHNPPLYSANNYFNNPNNLFGNICSMNILCIPSANPLKIRGLKEIA